MISTIKNIKNHHKAISMSCFNFPTLYTTMSHGKLIKVLYEIIDIFFKEGNEQLKTVGKYGAI